MSSQLRVDNILPSAGTALGIGTASGSITFNSSNISGDVIFNDDVTINGLLTYEDVTNIDSVGIVTARSDVSIADKIIHTGDTNTAIRFPAADTFTVETAGSERMRIASDGSATFGGTVTCGSIDVASTSTNGVRALGGTGQLVIQRSSSSSGRAIEIYDGSTRNVDINASGYATFNGDVTLNANLDMQDNDKILLGDGDDLQIYHNGSHSYIADEGSGELIISGSRIQLMNAARSEKAIDFVQDGAVDIYYDGSRKFRTTASGIEVTGTVTCDGFSAGDSDQIQMGDSADLRIYHDGSNSYIKNNTGVLRIHGTEIQIRDEDSNENLAKFFPQGAVELYYDNSKKFETKSNGTQTTGRIFLNGTNGGFDYNNTAHTLEFLVSNGTTHSELTHNAYVPSATGTRHLGYHNKRWDTLYVDKIAFGGSTNTDQHSLDDYEEGTWTPTMGFATSYGTQSGKYVKIGKAVHIWFEIQVTAWSTYTGSTRITNNPFPIDRVTGCWAAAINATATTRDWRIGPWTAGGYGMAVWMENGQGSATSAGIRMSENTFSDYSSLTGSLGTNFTMKGGMTYISTT